MDRPKMIKSIIPYICPHCGHDIFVCFGFIPPNLAWVIPKEEMEINKSKLKGLLSLITFKNDTEKKEAFDWVDSEDCVLGAEDIEDVAKMIEDEQKSKKK
jgi:hypothetical protein